MNKSDLIRKLANDHGLPVVLVQKVVNGLFDAIREDVLAGNTTTVSKFGSFYLRELKTKKIHNVNIGKKIVIPRRLTPSFTPAIGFKEAARKRGEEIENST